MSDNSPSDRAKTADTNPGFLRLDFRAQGSTPLGKCLREAFTRHDDEDEMDQELNNLIAKLN